ncbi:MAG: threonylcarbamoyl-AMP synthase [bacterium]|nr:threonylcarbamoyl-AMP synthase [bacterium]
MARIPVMTRVDPTPEGIRQAADAIAAGKVIAYPTETVYGLGVDPFAPVALDRLFAVKQRSDTHPVLVIVADRGQLARLAADVGPQAKACMDAFWPGPLSLVLPAVDGLPEAIAPHGKVCVRCPSCDVARGLCEAFGGPITSTSANLSGEPPARTVEGALLPGVLLGIDGGELAGGTPSTVYDPDENRMLREGAVAGAEIVAQLGR